MAILTGEAVLQIRKELDVLERESLRRDSSRYIRLLQDCGRLGALDEGRRVHSHLSKLELDEDLEIGKQLIEMYIACDRVDSARVVFSRMAQRDPCSWESAIAAFASSGHYTEVVQLYRRMRELNVEPSYATLIALLQLLAQHPGLESLAIGRDIHGRFARSRKKMGIHVACTLMDLYGKCGCASDAEAIFCGLTIKHEVAWNIIVAAFARSGDSAESLRYFRRMQQAGVKPSPVTFVNVLNAFRGRRDLAEARKVHSLVPPQDQNPILAAATIAMYGRCGCPEAAFQVYEEQEQQETEDWYVWNSMVGAFAENLKLEEALQIFRRGMIRKGFAPSRIMFISILHACMDLKALAEGELVHEQLVKMGWDADAEISAALIEMYARCGNLQRARAVFDGLENKSEPAKNRIVSAYAQNGQLDQSILFFRQVLLDGFRPTKSTFSSIANACSDLAEARRLLTCIDESGHETDCVVQSAAAAMFLRCGEVELARMIFNRMIAARLHDGDWLTARHLFQRMQLDGIEPDGSTFMAARLACRDTGLVMEGRFYFLSMTEDHGIPGAEVQQQHAGSKPGEL